MWSTGFAWFDTLRSGPRRIGLNFPVAKISQLHRTEKKQQSEIKNKKNLCKLWPLIGAVVVVDVSFMWCGGRSRWLCLFISGRDRISVIGPEQWQRRHRQHQQQQHMHHPGRATRCRRCFLLLLLLLLQLQLGLLLTMPAAASCMYVWFCICIQINTYI